MLGILWAGTHHCGSERVLSLPHLLMPPPPTHTHTLCSQGLCLSRRLQAGTVPHSFSATLTLARSKSTGLFAEAFSVACSTLPRG